MFAESAADNVNFVMNALIGETAFEGEISSAKVTSLLQDLVRKKRILLSILFGVFVILCATGRVNLRGVHKRLAARGFSSADIFRQGGSSDADVRNFWSKNFEFFEIYDVSYGQVGRGQFFVILCGRLLWRAPYKKNVLVGMGILLVYGALKIRF